MHLPLVRVALLALVMVVGAVAGEWLRPTLRLAEVKPAIQLEQQIPEAFGEWRLDRSIRPVLPDPSLQAMLDSLYSQVLARTYVNAQGQRIMLSIAYGSDQSNEATAVHRPEFCYSAQGFRVAIPRAQKGLPKWREPLLHAHEGGMDGLARENLPQLAAAALQDLGRLADQMHARMHAQLWQQHL
jgi:hypothetical protein